MQQLGSIETLYEFRLLAWGIIAFSPATHETNMRRSMCNLIDPGYVRIIEGYQGDPHYAFDMLTRKIFDVGVFRDAMADFVATCPAVHYPVVGLMSQFVPQIGRRVYDGKQYDRQDRFTSVNPDDVKTLVTRTRREMAEHSVWGGAALKDDMEMTMAEQTYYQDVQDQFDNAIDYDSTASAFCQTELTAETAEVYRLRAQEQLLQLVQPDSDGSTTSGDFKFAPRDMADFMAHTDAVLALMMRTMRKDPNPTPEDFAQLLAWAGDYRAAIIAARRRGHEEEHWAADAMSPSRRAEWMAKMKETQAARRYHAALSKEQKLEEEAYQHHHWVRALPQNAASRRYRKDMIRREKKEHAATNQTGSSQTGSQPAVRKEASAPESGDDGEAAQLTARMRGLVVADSASLANDYIDAAAQLLSRLSIE